MALFNNIFHNKNIRRSRSKRWIKAADLQPSIKGSDHCPVFAGLHNEITTDAGEKLVLRELMHMVRTMRSESHQDWRSSIGPNFRGSRCSCRTFSPSVVWTHRRLRLCGRTICTESSPTVLFKPT